MSLALLNAFPQLPQRLVWTGNLLPLLPSVVTVATRRILVYVVSDHANANLQPKASRTIWRQPRFSAHASDPFLLAFQKGRTPCSRPENLVIGFTSDLDPGVSSSNASLAGYTDPVVVDIHMPESRLKPCHLAIYQSDGLLVVGSGVE